MQEVLIIVVYGIVILAVIYILSRVLRREWMIQHRNPRPTFENGDKRIGEIELVDTQCIVFEETLGQGTENYDS